MGSCFAFLKQFITFSVLFLCILPYLPSDLFPNFPFEPLRYEYPDAEKIIQSYNWNNIIEEKGQVILKDEIIGPESLAISSDFIYTGLGDGRLVEINKRTLKVRTVTRFARKGAKICRDNLVINETLCGRPLGIRFHTDGSLYALDAGAGLFKVDVKTNSKQLIALGEANPCGIRGIFNDFVFDPVDPNIIYVTVSSAKWTMDRIIWSILEREETGFVVAVNLKDGKCTKILEGLSFPNGIELSADKKYLLIAITNKRHIIRVSVSDAQNAEKRKKAMKNMEIFIKDLPGIPDNLRVVGRSLFISLPLTRVKSSFGENLTKYPYLVKSMARAINLLARLCDFLSEKLKLDFLNDFKVKLNNGHVVHQIMPKFSSFIIVDSTTGKFNKMYGSKSLLSNSEVLFDPSENVAYLGSYHNKFLVKLKM